MKNISFYKIAFLIAPLFLIFSCAKEKDITTTTPNNPGPIENTDIYTVQGIVKDTLGQVIGGASLKAYFDDLEIETMSDMDGNYEFKIPKSKTEGYVVADKAQYARSIKNIHQLSNSITKNIFLVESFSSNEINLRLIKDSLRIIRGRTITSAGEPFSNASILYLGYSISPNFSIESISYTQSDTNGMFEIIIDNIPLWSEFVQVSYGTRCGTRTGFRITEEPLQDLQDIVLEEGTNLESELNINVSQLDCGNSSGLAKAYFTDKLGYGVWERPLGQIKSDYCSLGDSAVFFVGTHSTDKQEFNGRFYFANEVPNFNEFEICTPNGYFFELYKNGVLETGTMGEADKTIGNITLNGPNTQYIFISPIKSKLTSGGDIKIEAGRIQGMFSLDSNGQGIEELPAPEMGLYIDYLVNNDNEVSGIINGKMKENISGTINEYFIRFRIPKQ